MDAIKRGDYTSALTPLQNALRSDSSHALVHYNLSLTYAHLDSSEKAFIHYLNVVDLGSVFKDSTRLKNVLAHLLGIEPYPMSPIPMKRYNQFKGAPSPDGQLVAVAAARQDVANIYLAELDGHIQKKITSSGMNNDPHFSPSGDRIVFVSNRDGDEELYLYHVSTGEIEQLTMNMARDFSPSFSSDGKEVVFVSNMDDIYNWEIYKVTLSSKKISRLTKNKFWDGFPKYTRDGKSIVFSSRRDGSEDIYIMNRNGGHERVLYVGSADENDPTLYGDKLYFKSNKDGEWEIYQVDLNDNTLVRLTFNTYPDWNPRISTDGSKLFVSRKVKKYWQLYFINLNQPLSSEFITQRIRRIVGNTTE
jgi:Tol biopolymer transport system component